MMLTQDAIAAIGGQALDMRWGPIEVFRKDSGVITCYLKYVIDPYKLAEFEEYARTWIPIVNRMGGTHHGYFLPHEGANDIAYALFSFPSLAEYETYRKRIPEDAECQAVLEMEKRNHSILRYDRTFLRPVMA